jgi:hypothetical protein
MSESSNDNSIMASNPKPIASHADLERQATSSIVEPTPPKTLGAGVRPKNEKQRKLNITDKSFQTSLAIGVFATTLTTLSMSLMEWRGVTTTNVYVANFFFAAAFGLVITAQWELSVGNGFAYSVFSAFGKMHDCSRIHTYTLHANLSRTFLCWLRSHFDASIRDHSCVRR